MGLETFVDGPYRAFEADVPANLAGKEGFAVELLANGKIQLFNAGVAIGVLFERIQGSADWNVRLLGKGGTVKMVQNGAVVPGTQVKGVAGGKVQPLAGAGRSLGVKISPANNGVDGDVIEVIDVVEAV